METISNCISQATPQCSWCKLPGQNCQSSRCRGWSLSHVEMQVTSNLISFEVIVMLAAIQRSTFWLTPKSCRIHTIWDLMTRSVLNTPWLEVVGGGRSANGPQDERRWQGDSTKCQHQLAQPRYFCKHSFRMSCRHCENLFVSCKELWPKENSANDVLSLGLEDVLPLKVGSALEEGVNVTGKVWWNLAIHSNNWSCIRG